MNFNNKLDRHQNNLDAAHDALLDAGDREALEDEILNDDELFTRMAKRFLLQDGEELGEKNLLKRGFLEQAVEWLRLLDAGDREALETEALEDELLTDEELFISMAKLYANYCRDCPSAYSFLEFATERVRRERTAQWTKGWEMKP